MRAAGRAGVPAPPAPAPNEWLGPGAATRWRVAAAAIVSRRALPAACAPVLLGAHLPAVAGGGRRGPRVRAPRRPASPAPAAGGGGALGRRSRPGVAEPSDFRSPPAPRYFSCGSFALPRVLTPPPAPRIAPLRAEVVVSAGSARCTEASGRDREPSRRPAAGCDGLSGREAAGRGGPGNPASVSGPQAGADPCACRARGGLCCVSSVRLSARLSRDGPAAAPETGDRAGPSVAWG